jgi:two-component system NtrC family sensor kinase
MQNLEEKPSKSEPLREAIRLISIAQNQGADVVNPDHQYVRIMKEYFAAEGAEVLFIDPEDPAIMTKKESGKVTSWKITSNLKIDRGVLWYSYKTGEVLQIAQSDKNPLFQQPFDNIKDLTFDNLVCCPIISHSISFGSIGLINVGTYPLDDQNESLLMLFCSKLADHLFYNRLLKDVENAGDELKTSKLQLLHSRNVLRTLFDSLPESFYIVDHNFMITAVNIARASRIGLPPQEIVGRICHEVLYNSKTQCAGCLVQKTVQSSLPAKRLCNQRIGDSDHQEWEITTYPIKDKDGTSQQVILLEQDITEKRKLEAELIQSEKLAAVGQLAAGVAHEINNPLTAVLANAQMLLQDIPGDQTEMVESVKLIEMAALRASQVVKNLLGLVRKEEYEIEPVNLNDSIQSALMLVSHEFISRQIKIRFDRDEKMTSYIGSAGYLQGVWINLLMNAIEAIGSKKGEIYIATHYEDKNFYVEIRDTGEGISDANLDRIFEPFFSTKRSGHGTGLGLSLVRRTIQGHGGQILVESSPGKGARFTIILPERRLQDYDAWSTSEMNMI